MLRNTSKSRINFPRHILEAMKQFRVFYVYNVSCSYKLKRITKVITEILGERYNSLILRRAKNNMSCQLLQRRGHLSLPEISVSPQDFYGIASETG